MTTQVAPSQNIGTQNIDQHGSLLVVGIDREAVCVCLLENVSGQSRIAGWTRAPYDPQADVSRQMAGLCQRLGARLGRKLWDTIADGPFLRSDDPVRFPPVEQVVIAATPRPRLRVWVVGLSATLSVAAAQQALTISPAELAGSTWLTADLDGGRLAIELVEKQPDVLVIAGGYDVEEPAAQHSIWQLCRLVAQALERVPRGQRPVLLYAGNRWAAAQAESLLRDVGGPIQLEVLRNIQPTPDRVELAQLAHALNYHHWRLVQRMPGFSKLGRWVTSPAHLTNLESSFAQLVHVWMTYQNLHQLHGLYCTMDWWLHVWATAGQAAVRMHFVEPATRLPEMRDWPPVQLVSGPWPMRLWPSPAVCWWDRSGMAPMVATIGQVAPLAMLQVLQHDLLEARRKST